MPPCNCHPPFPRPEPFSPLPRPGKIPDWGKWIRDRLAEKGALLVLPTRASFPNPGAWPNLYLDLETGAVYRWDREDYAVLVDPREGNDVLVYDSVAAFPDEGEQGKLYIAANTGSLYRWGGEGYVALLPGKADRAVPQTAGNFAALTQDGNLADSGKKPSDYYTAEQVDEAIDKLAAYYITADAQGNPFATHAALVNAQTYYSGGTVRTPTRNDYAVVSADETHGGAEWRYIYAADAQGAGQWEPQYAVEGVIAYDNTVTRTSENGVKSSGIWSAIWGALSALPTGFSSLYDWVVAQLGLKRDYTDLSYDTTETVEVPALHSVMTVGGQTLAEYDLLCTEEVPEPPQIGHTYTWRADGAAFYVTQGVSALQTTWILYSQNGESLDGVTTQNATQGFYPDLDFRPSGAVITIHKTTAQKTVTAEDELALKSDIPAPSTATPAMDGTGAAGTSAAFARGDHVHPTDTSRMAASATGADIAVSGSDPTKIDAALAGKASTADATLTERGPNHDGFSAWTVTPSTYDDGTYVYDLRIEWVNGGWCVVSDDPVSPGSLSILSTPKGTATDTAISWVKDVEAVENITATRTALPGYQLGNDDQHILASEAEAEALRTGKQDALTQTQLYNIAAVPNKANDADVVHKSGDETIAGIKTFTDSIIMQSGLDVPWIYLYQLRIMTNAGNVYVPDAESGTLALAADIPYSLGTTIVIDTASSKTVEGETVNYGAATLANRTANIVQVTAATALDELRIMFPAATSGKVRDFGLRVEIGTGSAALAAPALVPIAPIGETIKLENADGTIPALADGTATAKGVTLLYFSETAPGIFVVTGEQVEEVA